MKNSVETIIGDIKKLFKELELAYGEIQPIVCKVDDSLEKCPNTKCWVQRIRDDQSDRIFEMERVILDAINELTAIIQKTSSDVRLVDQLESVSKRLEFLINPTPCQDCSKFDTCNKTYKTTVIHSESCVDFSNRSSEQEDPPDVAVQF